MVDFDTPEIPLIELDSAGEESDTEILSTLTTTSSPETAGHNAIASLFRPVSIENRSSRKRARYSTNQALQFSCLSSSETSSEDENVDLVVSPASWSGGVSNAIYPNEHSSNSERHTYAQTVANEISAIFRDTRGVPLIALSSTLPQQGTNHLWTTVDQYTIKLLRLEPVGSMRANELKDPSADRERLNLVKHINMWIMRDQMAKDRMGNQGRHAPLIAAQLGLLSTFYDNHPGEYTVTEVTQKSVSWFEGFDTRLFSKSVRSLPPEEKPLLVKYHFCDTSEKFEEFVAEHNAYHRKRVVFNLLFENCPLEVSRKPSDEFWESVNELFPPQPGCSPASAYTLKRHPTAFFNLLKESERAAMADMLDTGRQCHIFRDHEYKTLGLYLQDCILANHAESSCGGKELWWDLKPSRSVEYMLAVDVLNRAKGLSAKDIESIIQYRGQKGTFERSETTGQLKWKVPESEIKSVSTTLGPSTTSENTSLKEEETTYEDEKLTAEEIVEAGEKAKQELLQAVKAEENRKAKTARKLAHKAATKGVKKTKRLTGTGSTNAVTVQSSVYVSLESPRNGEKEDHDSQDKAAGLADDESAASNSTVINTKLDGDHDDSISEFDHGTVGTRHNQNGSGRWNTVYRGSQSNRRGRAGFHGGGPLLEFRRSQPPTMAMAHSNHTSRTLTRHVFRCPSVPAELFVQPPHGNSAAKHSHPFRPQPLKPQEQKEELRIFDDSEFPAISPKSASSSAPSPPACVKSPPYAHDQAAAKSLTTLPQNAKIVSNNGESPAARDATFQDETVDDHTLKQSSKLRSNPREMVVEAGVVSKIWDSSKTDVPLIEIIESIPIEIEDVSNATFTPAPLSPISTELYIGVHSDVELITAEQECKAVESEIKQPSQHSKELPSVVEQAPPKFAHDVEPRCQTSLHLGSYTDTNLPGNEVEQINFGSQADLEESIEQSPHLYNGRSSANASKGMIETQIQHDHAQRSQSPVLQATVKRFLVRMKPHIEPTQSQDAIKCTFCQDRFTPSAVNPLFLCPGCGPDTSAPRYCSVECLLVDSYDHSNNCRRFPGNARYIKTQLPHQYCVYEENALMGAVEQEESAELFRQRTFSLYCRYGEFPKLATAWCRRNLGYRFAEKLCDLDNEKLTGVYHIFESGGHRPGLVPNPKASVLYTITLENGDPLKPILSRALHSLYVHKETLNVKPITQFVFRAISHIITNPQLFNRWGLQYESAQFILKEFHTQFLLETGYHPQMDSFGMQPFNLSYEATLASGSLIMVESTYPLLLRWAMD